MHGHAGHATNDQVTTGKGEIAGAEATDAFARGWRTLRADGDIQFVPTQPPEAPKPPGWFTELFEFIGRLLSPVGDALGALGRLIGVSGQYLTWLVISVGAAILAYLAWRLLGPYLARGQDAAEPASDWVPDSGEAHVLLDDADRLAAEGRYDEATHLLLIRSVSQIAAARPDWLDPSTTAREIAALPALSHAARGAFTTISERVERSVFALRRLSADDWHAARAAYAEFALAAPGAT